VQPRCNPGGPHCARVVQWTAAPDVRITHQAIGRGDALRSRLATFCSLAAVHLFPCTKLPISSASSAADAPSYLFSIPPPRIPRFHSRYSYHTAARMPSAVRPPQTLYDKVFEDHIVDEQEGNILLYIGISAAVPPCAFPLTWHRPASGTRGDITGKNMTQTPPDRAVAHGVQQAFEGLRNASRRVRRPDCTLATVDHVRSRCQMRPSAGPLTRTEHSHGVAQEPHHDGEVY